MKTAIKVITTLILFLNVFTSNTQAETVIINPNNTVPCGTGFCPQGYVCTTPATNPEGTNGRCTSTASTCSMNIPILSLTYQNVAGNTVTVNDLDSIVDRATDGNDSLLTARVTATASNCTNVRYRFVVRHANGTGGWINDGDTGYGTENSWEFAPSAQVGLFDVIGYVTADNMGEGYSAPTRYFHMRVDPQNPMQIDGVGILTGTITVPWYDVVTGPNTTNPAYYLLKNSAPATTTNRSIDSSEIQIPANSITRSNFQGSPLWQADMNIYNFTVPSWNQDTTYYWRLRQQGSGTAAYIPGSEPLVSLTANPSSGITPFTTTLTLTVEPSDQQKNYYFWSHCDNSSNDLSYIITRCGEPEFTFTDVSSNTQSASYTYTFSQNRMPKALATFPGGNNPFGVEARTILQISSPTPFAPAGSSAVVFNNKMWVIQTSGAVFSSSDGQNWTEVGDVVSGFTSMNGHSSVVFNNGTGNKMWVIGGYNTYAVFSSSDGITWTQASSLPDIQVNVYELSSVVFQDKIWKLGGIGGENSGLSSWKLVFSSPNGIDWTQENDLPVELQGHSSVVFNNKIWVIGGSFNQGRVFSSANGTTWDHVGAIGSQLWDHSSVVFNNGTGNKMWVIGGYGSDPGPSDKVYASTDGITWTQIGTIPIPMAGHSSVVFNNKMWVIGSKSIEGIVTPYVFSSSDGINWNSEFNPCSGNISLALTPATVDTEAPFNAITSGLTSCTTKAVRFYKDTISGSSLTSCAVNNTGCTVPLTAPTLGIYTYYATIDKNSDGDTADTGENAQATLTVTQTGGTGEARGGTDGGEPGGSNTSTTATNVTKHEISGDATLSDIQTTDQTDSIFHISGNLTISQPQSSLFEKILRFFTAFAAADEHSRVVFVDGYLNINDNYCNTTTVGATNCSSSYTIDPLTGTVFVVKRDINIASDVTRIDAVLIAEGTIYTAGADCNKNSVTEKSPGVPIETLTINGSLISLKKPPTTAPNASYINFCRVLPSGSLAAEVINHQPKYLVILRHLMSDTLQRWSEIP